MTGFWELIAVIVVLSAPAVLPLLMTIGLRAELLFLAPLCGALLAAVSATLTLEIAATPMVWFLTLASSVNVAAVAILVRRGRRTGDTIAHGICQRLGLAVRGGRVEAVTAAAIAMACTLPLVGPLSSVRVDWDGRSIWLLHARWLYSGHDYLAAAVANPVFTFSHPEYPPAVPSAVAIGWQVTGGVDLRLGQLIIAVLNACAYALLGCAVVRCAGRVRTPVGIVLGGVLTAAAFGASFGHGAGRFYAGDGYADVLGAGCAAAAVLYGLVVPRSRSSLVISLLLALLAGSTKNEDLPVAVFVVLAVLLRYSWPLSWRVRLLARPAIAGGVLVGVLLSWPVLARLAGAETVNEPSLSILLNPGTAIDLRLGPTIDALRDQLALLPYVAALALLALLALRAPRRAAGLGSSLWVWSAIACSLVSLVVTYLTGPYQIDFWLATSVDRTTILARLLLLSEGVVWLVVILSRLSETVPAAYARWHVAPAGGNALSLLQLPQFLTARGLGRWRRSARRNPDSRGTG
jgi:hypothetical protein